MLKHGSEICEDSLFSTLCLQKDYCLLRVLQFAATNIKVSASEFSKYALSICDLVTSKTFFSFSKNTKLLTNIFWTHSQAVPPKSWPEAGPAASFWTRQSNKGMVRWTMDISYDYGLGIKVFLFSPTLTVGGLSAPRQIQINTSGWKKFKVTSSPSSEERSDMIQRVSVVRTSERCTQNFDVPSANSERSLEFTILNVTLTSHLNQFTFTFTQQPGGYFLFPSATAKHF